MTLQLLNPKLLVYAFTVFTGFLAPITGNFALVILAAFVLAVISFASTTVWALFGTAIKAYLHNQRHILVVNAILSLTLVYSALGLVEVL